MGREICYSYSNGENILKFHELSLKGAFLIELEKIEDERGFFARSWDKEIFEKIGLNSNIVQCNISFNKNKGTIRGLHYQDKPYQEVKLVRCTSGKVFEVIVDIRKNSSTYLKWESFELSSKNYKMLYVPEGFAMGFQTLVNNTEIFYQMSQKFYPKYSRGIRWNEPKLNIEWPLSPTTISIKDKKFELLKNITNSQKSLNK